MCIHHNEQRPAADESHGCFRLQKVVLHAVLGQPVVEGSGQIAVFLKHHIGGLVKGAHRLDQTHGGAQTVQIGSRGGP